MDYLLDGKTALVTGSTAGIGFAVAQLLAQEGATVIINGRTDARVTEAITKIKSAHPSAKLIPVAADLSEKSGIDTLTKAVPSVDILINNVGIYDVKPFLEISDDEWLHIFNTNVMSGIRLSRHYLPHLLKNQWGRIIFISSESGLQISADMVHYSMTKTAQLAISRGVAEVTAGTNITVNCVAPGPTWSEGVAQFIQHMAKQRGLPPDQIEKEFFKSVRPTSLLKRFLTTEEVAASVVFLASPIAAGITGSLLRVDGGTVKAIV